MGTTHQPKLGFWIIAIIALIWNAMGVMAYLGQVYITEEAMQAMTPQQQELFSNTPAWATGLFALSVFSGILGSLLLLLKKNWSVPLFLLSLISATIKMGHSFFMTNAAKVFGTTDGIIFPIIIIVIALFLYLYSKSCQKKGWLK